MHSCGTGAGILSSSQNANHRAFGQLLSTHPTFDSRIERLTPIVEKSGNWFSYNGTRLANGRANTVQYLRENPGIIDEIGKRVLAAYGLTGNATPASPSNGEAEEIVEAATRRERRKVAVE